MSMTGKKRKATALLVVFFVLFSALYLSMGMENGGTESGSAAGLILDHRLHRLLNLFPGKNDTHNMGRVILRADAMSVRFQKIHAVLIDMKP